jgi:hypothetical protein
MSSFYENIVREARMANERGVVEDIKNAIMAQAMSGDYKLVLDGDKAAHFDDTVSEYFTCQGFKIDKSETEIAISWEQGRKG